MGNRKPDNTDKDIRDSNPDNRAGSSPDEHSVLIPEFTNRILLEFNPLMYFMLNSDGVVTAVNENGAYQLGYTKSELTGKPVIDVFHKDDRDFVNKQLKICLKNPGKSYSWQLRKVRKDGDIIYVKEFASAIRHDSGDLFISVFCEDVTEKINTNRTYKNRISELEDEVSYERALRTFTQIVYGTLDSAKVLKSAAESLSDSIINSDCVLIYMKKDKSVELKAHSGLSASQAEEYKRQLFRNGILQKTFNDGVSRYVPDTTADPYCGKYEKELGIKSYISTPLWYINSVVGVIQVNSGLTDSFREFDIRFLKLASRQIECALNNARQADFFRNSADIGEKNRKIIEKDLRKTRKKISEETEKRRLSESRIKEIVKEKDFLLKKLQHRVKNNLQIILSLLQLQLRQLDDDAERVLITKTLNRVHTIAYIEEMLDDFNNISRLEFRHFIKRLVRSLLAQKQNISVDPEFNLEIKRDTVNINIAMPCALLLNELISNCLEHGFPVHGSGWISVEFKIDHNGGCLSVTDNGEGPGDDFDMIRDSGLGLKLVNSLSEQINGNFTFSTSNGFTEFRVDFKGDE